MARSKQALKGNPLNPPEDLLCGICGFGAKKGNKKMLETLKPCGLCKVSFPVHFKCAKNFFKHLSKKDDTFEESKFVNNKFKFFCNFCKSATCESCGKDHPVGTNKSYIAVCGAGHWYVTTEKCFPSSQYKSNSKQKWICPAHQKETKQVREVASSDLTTKEPKPFATLTPTETTLKVSDRDHSHVVTNWHESKRTKSLSMLFNKGIPEDVKTKLYEDFEKLMLSSKMTSENTEDENRLKVFIDAGKTLNQDFSTKCNQIDDKNKNLLTDTSLLPYSVSAGAIRRLKAENGLEAFINEEIIYLFKIFLQEMEIKKSPDDPHVYLPSCYEDILHPPVSKYPSTDFDKIIDSTWINYDINREQFHKEYSQWFISKPKGRLDIIFDYFQVNGKVS